MMAILSWNTSLLSMRVELLFLFVGMVSIVVKSRKLLLALFLSVGVLVFADQLYTLWHPVMRSEVVVSELLTSLGYAPNFIAIILKLIISFYCLVFGVSILVIDSEKIDNEYLSFFSISSALACFAVSIVQLFAQALLLETLFLINIYFVCGWTRKKQTLNSQPIDGIFKMIKGSVFGFFLSIVAVVMMCFVTKSENFSEIQSFFTQERGLGAHVTLFNFGLSIYILTILQKMGLGFFSGALLERLRVTSGIGFFPVLLFTFLTPFLALLQFVCLAITEKTQDKWSYVSQVPLSNLFIVIGLLGLVFATFATLLQKNVRSIVGLFALANISVVLMLLAELTEARLVVAALWILELGIALVVISVLQQINQLFNRSWFVALTLVVLLFDVIGTLPFMALSYRAMAFFEFIKQGQWLLAGVYLLSILLLSVAVFKLAGPMISRASSNSLTDDTTRRSFRDELALNVLVFVMCILPMGVFRIFWTVTHDIMRQCVRVFS